MGLFSLQFVGAGTICLERTESGWFRKLRLDHARFDKEAWGKHSH